jgi:biotin carboxyl carrier protein
MYNTDMPNRAELPSTGKLIRSTLLAAVAATVLLVTVVLPAEYAIDPTGAGRLLGLTDMGEIKQQLAEEAELDRANAAAAPQPEVPAATTPEPEAQEIVAETSAEPTDTAPAAAEAEAPAPEPAPRWRDEVSFTLTPGEGTEYKLTMEEGAVARFAWESEGGPVNFDTHGDGGGNAISYEKGRGVPEDEGDLEAAFTGNHGWFFRNRNDNDVTVVLRLDGDYGELKRML